MDNSNYLSIVAHYESCLAEHGDTCRGVDWPNAADAQTRYRVMLDLIPKDSDRTATLLDFGCGASHLHEFIRRQGRSDIAYSGLDMSAEFVRLSREKFPEVPYYCLDILEDAALLPTFDHIVLNGVFTEKCGLSYDEMLSYFKRVLAAVFAKARKSIAFNVMSKHVDWERDDLFHLPLDTLADFLIAELSRSFTVRNDYGLYEYTTYIYK